MMHPNPPLMFAHKQGWPWLPLVWPMVSVCLFFFHLGEGVQIKPTTFTATWFNSQYFFWIMFYPISSYFQYILWILLQNLLCIIHHLSFLGTDYEIFVCRRQVFFQAPPWRVPSPLGRTKLWPGRPGTLGPWDRAAKINESYINHHRSPWCWGIDSTIFFWEKPWCPSLEWLRWWKVSWAVGLCWIYDTANDRTVDGVYKPTFLTGWRHLGWRGTSEAFFTRFCDVQFWKTLGRQNSWKW